MPGKCTNVWAPYNNNNSNDDDDNDTWRLCSVEMWLLLLWACLYLVFVQHWKVTAAVVSVFVPCVCGVLRSDCCCCECVRTLCLYSVEKWLLLLWVCSYLVFVQCWEVVVAEQNTQLFFLQCCRQLTQAVVSELRCRLIEKLFSYQRYTDTDTHTYMGHDRALQKRKLLVPRTHNKLCNRSFSAAGPWLWNDLPPGLRQPGLTFDSFRQSLKTHLFGDRSA